MVPSKDILFTIRERAPHGDELNHIIGDAIIQAPESFVDISVKHLAGLLGVSEPSIIRYCRSLGCNGFKDFKKYLAQSLILEEKFSREADRGSAPVRIFGAICPEQGKGAGLVLPFCNTETMSLHLAEIALAVAPVPTRSC